MHNYLFPDRKVCSL